MSEQGWISSITDQNGYTTHYSYDAMGCLTGIAFPGDDSVAWNTTTQTLESVGTDEYGLAGGHWRQTVTTGNQQKFTYFDALWRPIVIREHDAADEAGTQRFQRFAYDHAGRTTFDSYPGTSDALTTGNWIEYDALGRVISVSQDSELGLLTTLTEYLAGNQTRVTDPRGNQTVTGSQVFNEPAYDKPVWILHKVPASTSDYIGGCTGMVGSIM